MRPTSDNAPGRARVERQGSTDSADCAKTADKIKHERTVVARGAMVGLVLEQLADGAWQVLNQWGQPATVQSLQAAEALVYGCELVRADVAALMGRLVRPQAVNRG